MDFGLNEEQEMLKTMARDFLAAECPKSHVRAMLAEERGFSEALWAKMAELGWLGLPFPEAYGGMGGSLVDLAVLCEEMGRALLPSPFLSTVVMGGTALMEGGIEEQRGRLLPKVASGKLFLTLAQLEDGACFDASGVNLRAERRGNGRALAGSKLFVPDGLVSDYAVVAARTSDAGQQEEGITLFLVNLTAPGVARVVLESTDVGKLAELTFKDVAVTSADVLGEVDRGWPLLCRINRVAAMAASAQAVGGAQQVMEMAVSYASDRIQFGRPIATFQAIKHRCADMLVDVETARTLAWYAAWAVDVRAPDEELAVSVAKAWCSDACRRVTANAIQVHGGIGFTWDHDVHLYFKRARAIEVLLGDPDWHREKVCALFEAQVQPGV